MEKKLLHTPEGVRDIYNSECKKMLCLQDKLHRKFKEYGFCDIKTPSIEYFDVFSKDVGTIPSKELYKFFDREGNTLVLRPDYTPSIARCAATYFMEEDMPIRFCYAGNVFINESGMYQGKLKETTQMGAEMIGDTTIDADVEMLALVIQLLMESGLKKFQVEVGQVEFFKGLLEEAQLEEEDADTLRELISRKNYFGLEELLSDRNIDKELKEVFLKLPELFGSVEILKKAAKLTKNPRALKAIERLEAIYDMLSIYKLEKYVTFDLGMLSKYNYYTGIIFKAYTMGTGEAVVTGGRYNNLLGLFGKSAPSIGFTLVLDTLMTALSSQKISVETGEKNILLLYHENQRKTAMSEALKLRNDGEYIELIRFDNQKSIEDYKKYASRNEARFIWYYPETGDKLEIKL